MYDPFVDESSSDSGSSTSNLLASIFHDAASVASTAIASANTPAAPPLYQFGSTKISPGTTLLGSSTSSPVILLGLIAVLGGGLYLLSRKRR